MKNMNKKLKLIQVLEHYHLYDGDKAIATSIVGNPMLLPNLSIKNCETIKRGYDLDELAMNFVKKVVCDEASDVKLRPLYEEFFIEGAKAIIQILGDKKFSEEDALKIFNEGAFYGSTKLGNTHYFDAVIQSVQQTEWDVEVDMVDATVVHLGGDNEIISQPKLDEKGKIILKRI